MNPQNNQNDAMKIGLVRAFPTLSRLSINALNQLSNTLKNPYVNNSLVAGEALAPEITAPMMLLPYTANNLYNMSQFAPPVQRNPLQDSFNGSWK